MGFSQFVRRTSRPEIVSHDGKRIYRKTRCNCIHDHLLGTSWIYKEVVRGEANGEKRITESTTRRYVRDVAIQQIADVGRLDG